MILSKFFYLIKEGIKSIFKHGFMSIASVTIMVACLIIMGSFSLLAVNIDAIIDDLESENETLAFVDDSYTEDEARALQSKIEAVDNVASVEFVTRQEAYDNYVSQYDDPALFEDIEASVFRDRYVIFLDDISLMSKTKADLEKIDGIAKVNAELDISRGFVRVRNIVSAISMVLIVILVVVSIFIMANTVKLTTFGRREEIAIMKMVGAGNAFIRFPFIIEGLVLGAVGAAIAFFAEWGIYSLVCNSVMEGIIGSFVDVIPFTAIYMPVLIAYLAIGVLVGAFGGVIAIRNYLKV
jgi:cell division transport system permease protein